VFEHFGVANCCSVLSGVKYRLKGELRNMCSTMQSAERLLAGYKGAGFFIKILLSV